MKLGFLVLAFSYISFISYLCIPTSSDDYGPSVCINNNIYVEKIVKGSVVYVPKLDNFGNKHYCKKSKKINPFVGRLDV